MSERKPPRLVVRKDAERELEYHYRREERLERGSAPGPTPAGGPFFKNRTFRIVLLNAVLLAVIVFVGQRLLLASGDRLRIGGYSAALQALRYGQTVYATLSVRLVGRAQAGEERFGVRFVLEPGGEAAEQAAALPEAAGQEVTVGEAIPISGDPGAVSGVRAELTIGGRTRRMHRGLPER